MPRDSRADCPIAGMVPFEREFLAKCHAEAHHRNVKARPAPRAVPPLRTGLSVARAPRRVLALVIDFPAVSVGSQEVE